MCFSAELQQKIAEIQTAKPSKTVADITEKKSRRKKETAALPFEAATLLLLGSIQLLKSEKTLEICTLKLLVYYGFLYPNLGDTYKEELYKAAAHIEQRTSQENKESIVALLYVFDPKSAFMSVYFARPEDPTSTASYAVAHARFVLLKNLLDQDLGPSIQDESRTSESDAPKEVQDFSLYFFHQFLVLLQRNSKVITQEKNITCLQHFFYDILEYRKDLLAQASQHTCKELLTVLSTILLVDPVPFLLQTQHQDHWLLESQNFLEITNAKIPKSTVIALYIDEFSKVAESIQLQNDPILIYALTKYLLWAKIKHSIIEKDQPKIESFWSATNQLQKLDSGQTSALFPILFSFLHHIQPNEVAFLLKIERIVHACDPHVLLFHLQNTPNTLPEFFVHLIVDDQHDGATNRWTWIIRHILTNQDYRMRFYLQIINTRLQIIHGRKTVLREWILQNADNIDESLEYMGYTREEIALTKNEIVQERKNALMSDISTSISSLTIRSSTSNIRHILFLIEELQRILQVRAGEFPTILFHRQCVYKLLELWDAGKKTKDFLQSEQAENIRGLFVIFFSSVNSRLLQFDTSVLARILRVRSSDGENEAFFEEIEEAALQSFLSSTNINISQFCTFFEEGLFSRERTAWILSILAQGKLVTQDHLENLKTKQRVKKIIQTFLSTAILAWGTEKWNEETEKAVLFISIEPFIDTHKLLTVDSKKFVSALLLNISESKKNETHALFEDKV